MRANSIIEKIQQNIIMRMSFRVSLGYRELDILVYLVYERWEYRRWEYSLYSHPG